MLLMNFFLIIILENKIGNVLVLNKKIPIFVIRFNFSSTITINRTVSIFKYLLKVLDRHLIFYKLKYIIYNIYNK